MAWGIVLLEYVGACRKMLDNDQRRIDDIRNAEDLKTVVAEIWTSLQLHYIRRLYDSLPRRLRVVLRARGNITKY
jgi:hypothetical protein